MKYMIVLLLTVAAIPSHAQKWDHGFKDSENTMPDWEGWSDESACEEEYESPLDDVHEAFIASGGMSFSDFTDYMNDYGSYYSDDPELQSSVLYPSSSSYDDWVRRIYLWEDEIPDISGFTWMLKQIELSMMQITYLDALSLWVEYEVNQLQDYHEIDDIRCSFFEGFVEDFYMPVGTYFLWEERNWYQSDLHDLLADAMSEIHDMLSSEQLAHAEQIVEYMLSHPSPEHHAPQEGR
ncbi:MAG: hypothetical protein KAR44_02175 [Candidatus Aegiribacteria sp.]|nr:hypothetical protein [Candidatus Aegiribacteria sp.]